MKKSEFKKAIKEEINKKILDILDLRGIKYTTIQGNTKERIKTVKSVVFS